MGDKISVIIPVYNVARYLPQCLDSVLGQDHRDLEVIVIDDGSTDASGAICDQYAARDPRLRVIHQKNAGAAAAKNAGLRIATGEYLSFVDSDDFLEPNVYGFMLEALKTSGADAAQFSYRDCYVNRTEDQILPPEPREQSSREYLVRFTKDWSCALLWNKLYRREIYQDIFFEEGHKIDDEYFTYQGFLAERKIVFDRRIIYNYRRRKSSVMASPQTARQRILDSWDAIGKRRQKVVQVFPELKKAHDHNYLDALWYLSENPASNEEMVASFQACLRKYLCQWGNSFPPRYLWPMLARILTLPPKVQMARRKPEAPESLEDCFE